jgi:hypothetical protein
MFDVFEATHRVEVVPVVVIQRGLGAQALVRRIWVAMDFDVVWIEVHVAGQHRRPDNNSDNSPGSQWHVWAVRGKHLAILIQPGLTACKV